MCLECYSEFSRITPLIEPEDCLRSHRQYVCRTCGRCICANRGLYPFKALEIATLYLRPVEAIKGVPCGVYELDAYYPKKTKGKKTRKNYKIFADSGELEAYLKKNPTKSAASKEPTFSAEYYTPVSEADLRALTQAEVATYMQEKGEQAELWRDFLQVHDIKVK
jgi:hypothetical protein